MNIKKNEILARNAYLFPSKPIEKVFVIGTAANLNDYDLEFLKGEFCITLNSFYLHPLFQSISNIHLLIDPNFFNNESWVKAGQKTKSFFQYKRQDQKLVAPLYPAYEYLIQNDLLDENCHFLDWDFKINEPEQIDLTSKVPAWGQNIIDTAILLATSKKVKEIILIGIEHGGVFKGDENYSDFIQSDTKKNIVAKHISNDPEFFTRALAKHINQLNGIKRYAKKNHIKIFTTSAKGALRLFPYKSLSSFNTTPLEQQYKSNNIISAIFENLTKSKPNLLHLYKDFKAEAVSNQALLKRIYQYNQYFQENGIKNELIVFIKKLDLDLIAAYLGAIASGNIPAQISPLTKKLIASEYQIKVNHILASTKATHVFTSANEFDFQLPDNIHVHHPLANDVEASEIIIENEIALAQFSSGSTGLQKGVILTHQQILEHMSAYAKHLNLRSEDRLISWLPLYHDMGLIACFLMPLTCGFSTYLMDPFTWLSNPSFLLSEMQHQKATIAYLPNFAYHLIARTPSDIEIPSLRYLVNCSEPAKTKSHQIFSEAFPNVDSKKITVCYALAENTFAVSQSLYGEQREILIDGISYLSCGKIISHSQVHIFEPNDFGIGEIGIKSSSLFENFLDGSKNLDDGYYRTGDLGIIDADELFVCGRKKDLLIINGKNIFPQDVEYVVSNFEGVYPGRVCAISLFNQSKGSEELVVLFEPHSEEINVDKSLLNKKIEHEVGILATHLLSVPRESLVKTSSGKISRARNKELYEKKSFLNKQHGELKC